jgi:prepilin-type N-terminal cleavage/methylation domain-containing protein
MRATIKNYIDAAKRRREEEGEEGFSLIELIIVVVILGILVAVAIPVFANIQTAAQENALKAAAANGATAGASLIASAATAPDEAAVSAAAATAGEDGIVVASTGATIDTLCATATGWGKVASSGPAPGCSGIADEE